MYGNDVSKPPCLHFQAKITAALALVHTPNLSELINTCNEFFRLLCVALIIGFSSLNALATHVQNSLWTH